MARHSKPRSPATESWDDGEEEESEELLGPSFFPPCTCRMLMSSLLANTLRAADVRVALEALAKCTNDQALEWNEQDMLPGWDDAKEFIGVVLPSIMDKFYRLDVFLRVHQDNCPEQLFACMYYLGYACSGFTSILAEWSPSCGDVHDHELAGLLNATYTMLDSRSEMYRQPCVRQLPDLNVLIERTENYLLAQLPGQLSGGESDDDAPEPKPGVIHLRNAEGGNQWQAYLVQMLRETGFVDNAIRIIAAPRFHTMHLHSTLLSTLLLVIQLLNNIVHQQLSQERRRNLQMALQTFLCWVSDEVLAEPEKFFGGRDRGWQSLSPALMHCNGLMEFLQLPNTQLTYVQRKVVIEMLKSSNFSRLLSAVQECRHLLDYSCRRSSRMVEGNADPDVVGLEDNVRWLDQERIVKQMLRVNLHQSQYVDAVLGILCVLAECGHFNDEHLDMLWGVTEQEDTFDAVKTNVCHMIKQLAAHLRPQQLDLLFSKFENRKGRTLSDTLRLLDLLRRLAQSDTTKAGSMAGKLVELVWELTTPADAPPELLDSSVMLDVLEGYKQHALLHEYIQRCVGQLRARNNVYTALTVLQNLLRLWGKLYGWEARPPSREERRSGAPRPLAELLGSLDREPVAGQPQAPAPLSRLLVDNLVDFMAAAARWLEERRGPPSPPQAAAGGDSGAASTAAAAAALPQQQPPGQGSYSYQQIVRRYLEVFRLVCQCKDTYTELRLVEALWDAVVLRPNTPEDMPLGLDLILACAGEADDDDAAAAAAAADGMVTPPGPLLDARDLSKLLQDRVSRLPVENLAQPAFLCFKACLHAAQSGLEEHRQSLAGGQTRASRGELDEQGTIRLLEEVGRRGQSYLWQIVLDCQRSEVTASASDMLINEVYGKAGIEAMISDARTKLMESAAILTGAPAGTKQWEAVELPADVMESSRWEQARTRATRCMQLLEQLAGKGEEAMPPVPMHSASWQGPGLVLEVNTQDQGRIKVACFANEYVGLLRRKVAQRLGADPACVRLVAGGQELKSDGRTLQSALPPTRSSRQTLLAQVSPRFNRYTRFGEEWWEAWHGNSTLAHMFHDDQLYRVLLLLADLPKAPGVRAAASRLLQQLPTCSWVPAALLQALLSDQPAAQLRRQLLGPNGGAERPGLLLYTLQALYALLQPSYPADLLPLVSKPWINGHQRHQPQLQQPQHLQAAEGGEADADLAAAEQASAAPPQPGHTAAAAAASPVAWWQVVAAGGATERLLPVLAKCVPLLAEVVDQVMAPVAGAAEAVTAAAAVASAGAVPGASSVLDAGRRAAMQPAADLSFIKDFQWVMVFLLCNIHHRAWRAPFLDGSRAQLLAGAAAGATPQPADSLSSSHGHGHHEAGPSTAAARRNQQQHPPPVAGPAASGGQDSEVVTQEAAAAPLDGSGGGGGAAAAAATPPEVSSADAEAQCMSVQLPTAQGVEGGDSVQPQATATCGSAAAALVSGLAVSSRGSPDVGVGGRGGGRDPAGSSFIDTSGAVAAAGAAGADHGAGGGVQALPPGMASQSAQVPMCGSSTDVEMMPVAGPSQQLPPAALSQQLPPAAPSPAGAAMSVSMAQAPTTAAAAAPQPGFAPVAAGASGAGGSGRGGSAAGVASDGYGNLRHYLSPDGVRCLVSLLVRMAHDASCLWGYAALLRAQQQQQAGAGARMAPGLLAAAASGAPSQHQMCAAADVACRLADKALNVVTKLIRWPDLRQAFMEDPRAVPMLLETLACVFAPAIRESAQNLLEGVFAGGPQLQLPPTHYMWVLTSLVSLRPAMETRLDSCLEFHVLLGKVLHQLPELSSPSTEARQLADRLLSEEVARLDAGAEELLEPGRALLLRGKLLLVRELVRALERLGLGLGTNGRPGLISILLNRYLFPEAVLLWQPAASHLAMEGALQHVAGEPGVRREALQLVQFLMTACPANLEQGYRDLARLHYDNGLRIVDRKFDICGEGLRSEGCYVGLRNGGATCYMNSVMQQLFMQPRIRELVLQAGAVDPEEQQESVFHQLQVMFAHLQLGCASCFHPRGFWQAFKDYDGQPIDVREHQDAYEFFTRLQDSVDSYLRATGQTPAMQAVMGGKFAAQIICKDVPYRSEREEEFYQISCDVKGFHSLEKSLEGYVAGELMEGDNSYYCEELGSRVAAVKRTVIKELPQTLVVHLKRFEYDHLNMTRYKLRDRFEFPVVLDMFKYTADGLAALEATGAAAAAAGQAGMEGGGSGAAGAGGSGSDGASRSRNSYLYELKGIVVHSGTAFAGHYYSFIKERPRLGKDGQVTDGCWYRFDDKVVSPWSINDLEADCFGGRPPSSAGGVGRADTERPYSAYMLFYERRDAASYDRPVADMRAVPRDLVIAAAATPIAATPPAPPQPGAAGLGEASTSSGNVPAGEQQAERQQRAGTGGVGEPEDMEMDGPQQERAGASLAALRAVDPPVIMTPYGMPVLLYQHVLRENLQLMHKLHVLNKEYFAFVRQVVEVTWETVLAGRKTRRRDLHHHPHPTPHAPPAGGNNGTGGGNGNGALPPSSGANAAPTATTTTMGTTTTGAGAASGSGGAESSSAPSQRNEELDETVLLSARLASAFLLHIYIPAPSGLRADLPAWRDMLRHMLQASPRACVELLRLVANSTTLRQYYFTRYAQDGCWLAELLAFALQAATRAATAAAAGSPGGEEPAPQPPQQPATLSQQVQGAAMALTNTLSELTFSPLREPPRSEPQHLPLCRCLAGLVAGDMASAYLLINGHLRDVFALPGFLLTDMGAANDPDLTPELSAALQLLHEVLQYCTFTPPQSAGLGAGPVRMATAATAAGAPPRMVLHDLTDELETMAGLQDNGVFEAALAHGGLLGQAHVAEVVRFLLTGSGSNSLRFMNCLLARLGEVETAGCGAALLDSLEALPVAMDVYDALRNTRYLVLIFGNANTGLRGSLQRLLVQAQARQQGLSWLGMVVGQAVASLWTGSEFARSAIRSAPAATLLPFVNSFGLLAKQLSEFAHAQGERAAAAAAAQQQQGQGGSGGGAAAAAREAAASAAALTLRARRISNALTLMVQQVVPIIHAAQARVQGPPQVQAHQHHQQHQQPQQHQQQHRHQQQQQVHVTAAVRLVSREEEEGEEQDGDDGARGPVRVEEVGVEEGDEVGRVYAEEEEEQRPAARGHVGVHQPHRPPPPQQQQVQLVPQEYGEEEEEADEGEEGEGEADPAAAGLDDEAEQAEADEGEDGGDQDSGDWPVGGAGEEEAEVEEAMGPYPPGGGV